MVDLTDDWMNPQGSGISYTTPPAEDKDEFLIERARRMICFGNPGSIVQWCFWSKHETAEERDKELDRLHAEHPAWHLRARTRNRWREQHGISPPVSHPGINR